ncbi:MAG: hypothetical protein U1F67_21740 [Rubrivivax sp.]
MAGAGASLTLLGLAAALVMEEHGHAITGMDNQIVWARRTSSRSS